MKNKKYIDDNSKCGYSVFTQMCGFMSNGVHAEIREPKTFIGALFWVIVYRFKYPHVLLTIGDRAFKCEYCPFDNCEGRE